MGRKRYREEFKLEAVRQVIIRDPRLTQRSDTMHSRFNDVLSAFAESEH